MAEQLNYGMPSPYGPSPPVCHPDYHGVVCPAELNYGPGAPPTWGDASGGHVVPFGHGPPPKHDEKSGLFAIPGVFAGHTVMMDRGEETKLALPPPPKAAKEGEEEEPSNQLAEYKAHALLLAEFARVPKGPVYGESPESVSITALANRSPGVCWSSQDYWAMFSFGADAVVEVPMSRWDLSLYYSEDQEPGKGYIRHYGFLTDDQMACFDNKFFGISEEEAYRIDPPARNLLEVGYDCLHRAGWTRAKLQGTEMVASYGFSDSEFTQMVARGAGILPYSQESKLQIQMCTSAARLHYVFGMKGPCSTTETACSSSLSAVGLLHKFLRPTMPDAINPAVMRKQVKFGLAQGSNGHFDPFYTIALCGASMLSHGGRCFTFDQSADGFIRGEGCGAMFFRVMDTEDLSRLAMLCGTCLNQDGRSASLTAPHGPSQQECIRFSLREAGIRPLDIQIQELHGTGTALGDPIEVGALRATMMRFDGVVREHPLVKTSSKSNIGHTEMCAGINGLIKCVLMGVFCSAAPNVHMRLLNPHIDSASYPVYFSNEFVDQGKETGYHGVSSFGFGGSNARGDIWARAQSGPRNTQPGNPFIDFSSRRVYSIANVFGSHILPPAGQPSMVPTDEDLADFEEQRLQGCHLKNGAEFYCIGTFNGWSMGESSKMLWIGDQKALIYALQLGETLVEQFQIVRNKHESETIFPTVPMGNEDSPIRGPGFAPKACAWAIDGRQQKVRPGTTYFVQLVWNVEAHEKRISWQIAEEGSVSRFAAAVSVSHYWTVVGTWTAWRPLKLRTVRHLQVYETFVRIGPEGRDRFHFCRDGDKRQAIYPVRWRATSEVQGPDACGEDKFFEVSGRTGEQVLLRLEISEGEIRVTMRTSRGTSSWESSNWQQALTDM